MDHGTGYLSHGGEVMMIELLQEAQIPNFHTVPASTAQEYSSILALKSALTGLQAGITICSPAEHSI